MEERRREPRSPVEIAVEVWGRDESGAPFTETVKVRSASVAGGLLEGMWHAVRCGDILAITNKHRQARFRVVWARDFGAPVGQRIAVHKVDGQECPWAEELHLLAQP